MQELVDADPVPTKLPDDDLPTSGIASPPRSASPTSGNGNGKKMLAKTIRRVVTTARMDGSPHSHAANVTSDALEPSTIECILDVGGQHTLRWTTPVALKGAATADTLPPGSCNLYGYPKVFFSHLRKGKGVVPPAEQLLVLEELVRGTEV